jgi:hypothetical protein
MGHSVTKKQFILKWLKSRNDRKGFDADVEAGKAATCWEACHNQLQKIPIPKADATTAREHIDDLCLELSHFLKIVNHGNNISVLLHHDKTSNSVFAQTVHGETTHAVYPIDASIETIGRHPGGELSIWTSCTTGEYAGKTGIDIKCLPKCIADQLAHLTVGEPVILTIKIKKPV